MLVDPGQTAYDLRFRLFGTPVRVHPFFWLFSAVLGWDIFMSLGFAYLFLWVACCFVSILLHEFGHIWAGHAFGSRGGHVVLYSFGGLAIGAGDVRYRWQRISVSLAGPAIQLVLYGLIRTWVHFWPDQVIGLPWWAVETLGMLLEINLIWPLFNLLPVWPLDGGQVNREVCSIWSPRNGLRISLGISAAVAGFIAVHALLANARGAFVIPYLPTGLWIAILFGMLAIQSWQLMRQIPRHTSYREEADDRLPWESDPDAWKRR